MGALPIVGPPGLSVLVAVTAVTVPAVHEHVHQRASEDEQVGQNAEQVGGVLGDQVEAANRRGDEQRQTCGRAPEGRRLGLLMVHNKAARFTYLFVAGSLALLAGAHLEMHQGKVAGEA